ncbi:hypothetical protein BSKO_10231 [Bryopsis sp. KO-2023]|nr:hypothetical protein BSKO_10231 [Bryopsis sp. KO-2023]
MIKGFLLVAVFAVVAAAAFAEPLSDEGVTGKPFGVRKLLCVPSYGRRLGALDRALCRAAVVAAGGVSDRALGRAAVVAAGKVSDPDPVLDRDRVAEAAESTTTGEERVPTK